jgi:hypothetical protein
VFSVHFTVPTRRNFGLGDKKQIEAMGKQYLCHALVPVLALTRARTSPSLVAPCCAALVIHGSGRLYGGLQKTRPNQGRTSPSSPRRRL